MVRGHYLMTQIPEGEHIGRNSFGFLIQTLARRIDAGMKERLKERDIDIKIFANLMFLSGNEGVTQKEIGNRLNFPDYYTSRNVDALIKQGFAERRPDPNSRRTTLIYLTDKGRAKAAELPAVIRASNEETLADLSAKEREQVMALLQKVLGL